MLAALNDAWQRASDVANSLRDQLVADSAASFAMVRGGSIASVGKNSANQTYKSYGPASLTQIQVIEIVSNLLGLYDQLKSQITCQFTYSADFDFAVPAGFDFDPVIYPLLSKLFLAQSSGAGQMLPDVTRLRLPASFPTSINNLTW